MKIQPLYEICGRIMIRPLSRLIYKANKLLVNKIYPRTIRDEKGVNPESDIIVSLTSFPERISTVWITIQTLLHQSVKPQRIILWLAEDQFPNRKSDIPQSLLRLEEYGLEIHFCDNLFPHKKYYYTIKNYPDNKVITVDDDIFYPENLIEELEKLSYEFPGCICCTWAHEITTSEGKLQPYRQWKHCVMDGGRPSIKIIPIGCGGVLYPAHSLAEEVFDKGDIKALCLRTDDLWLKSMAVKKGIKSVRWRKNTPIFYSNISSQDSALYHQNLSKNRNDECLSKILAKYPDVEKRIIEEE